MIKRLLNKFCYKNKGYGANTGKTAIHSLFKFITIYLRTKRFSGLTFIRYARGQNIGSMYHIHMYRSKYLRFKYFVTVDKLYISGNFKGIDKTLQ